MNLLFLKLRVLIKIISAIFRIYRRVLNLYQRFPNYIGATQFISAISQLYRRNSIYISDFPIISAQLNLYQRFPNYISVCLNISTYQQNPTIKRSAPINMMEQPPILCFYTRFQLYFSTICPSSFHFTAR